MEKRSFVTAVILAAGSGSRMNSQVTKQRMEICGESVLGRCLRTFEECKLIDAIVVVCREDEMNFAASQAESLKKVVSVICGGNTRAESAKIGFCQIPKETDFVAIHDGARCLVTTETVERVVKSAFVYGAATAAKRVTDTIKRVDSEGFVSETVPRDELYAVQTPQVFRVEDYSLGLSHSSVDSSITDDNMIIERIGGRVFCVECREENIKITTPDDISYAEFIIKRRESNA